MARTWESSNFGYCGINGPFDLYPVEPVGVRFPVDSEDQLNFHQLWHHRELPDATLFPSTGHKGLERLAQQPLSETNFDLGNDVAKSSGAVSDA